MRRLKANMTIDRDVLRELDRLADRDEESRSEIANQLLREALNYRAREDLVTSAAEAGVGTAALGLVWVFAAHLITFIHVTGVG